MKFEQVTRTKAKQHYHEHKDKEFYPSIEDYIVSSPVVIMVIAGVNAVSKIRLMVGATEPASALPGTIRGDFAHQAYPPTKSHDNKPIRNLNHASATFEEAQKEIAILVYSQAMYRI